MERETGVGDGLESGRVGIKVTKLGTWLEGESK